MNIPAPLIALAPIALRNRRRIRFNGDGMGIATSQLTSQDREIACRIYQAVRAVADLRGCEYGPQTSRMHSAIALLADDDFVISAQRLGQSTREANIDETQLAPLHDVRGGALAALISVAFALRRGVQTASLDTCGLLARDHCKIMRNALPDLDPPRRQYDMQTHYHGVEEFVLTWDGATLCPDGRPVQVQMHCEYTGGIAASCLENAALDRVLYNHINNAARFTANGRVALWIFSVGHGAVRWVVSNAMRECDSQWLASAAGANLCVLYRGGLTRGGVGAGLAICADFVASAFGVPHPQIAVNEGYLGAAVVDGEYHAWFHWPAYEGDPGT